LLEVCSGAGSIGRVFRMHDWEAVSVDMDPKMRPTFVL